MQAGLARLETMANSSLSEFLAKCRAGLSGRCRGCLGPLDAAAEAGLCGACWQGLLALDSPRCLRCALRHDEEATCPDPVSWERGDALWRYRGGRPPLGALLVPGIKAGERGWMRALLRRAAQAPLPEWVRGVHLVTCAPASPWRRLLRGFDLAEEAARRIAARCDAPFLPLLGRAWAAPRQAVLGEAARRRMPAKAIRLRRHPSLEGRIILLVDDVWTTGTTLLRCAQALQAGGATEVRVLTLFRAD